MRCLLVGNYGVANLGDELLRDYFTRTFPDVTWTVVSAYPEAKNEVPRLPLGFRSLFTPWWRTIYAYAQCDAVVFGGGTLFTDVESLYACFLWLMHALFAVLLRKKLILAFQGIGPFHTRTGEKCARFAARHSVLVSVRDPSSMMRVRSWGLHTKVVQTFDPVFSLMQKEKITRDPKKVFVVIPRYNSGMPFLEKLKFIYRNNYFASHVRVLLLQPDSARERSMIREIQILLNVEPESCNARSLSDVMEGVADACGVVSQRFHGGIAALAAGVPLHIIPQGMGDKLWELEKYADQTRDVAELGALVAAGEQACKEALEI